MRDDDDASLPPSLRRAISVLREAPAPRDEWVAAVVSAAAEQRFDDMRPIDDTRRWAFRPSVAIAASLLFAATGAGVTYVAMRGGATATKTIASLEAQKTTVRFALVAPGAVSVQLVGDFNAWDAKALPMRRSSNGETWEVEVGLAPGRYTYAFVVDGRLARDPSAAEAAHDDFGSPNSVLLVKGS
jgi:hypothetical protein